MKINIKRQSNRSTQWLTGLNCVNLFLVDPRFGHNFFEIELRVTEWGSKTEIEPVVSIEHRDKEYTFTINELLERLGIE